MRVLWIDDEYKPDVIGDAEQDGIDLIPFESHEEGIAELLSNIDRYHAVILDARVKKLKSDTTTGLDGLTASRDKLIEINNQGKYMPYFIFTGEPDYKNAVWFRQTFGDYFIKGQDNQRLFNSIKEKVQNKDEYIVQSEFKRIFDICDKYFDPEVRKHLTVVLCSVKKPNVIFDDKLYFTQIRIILESHFRIANKMGLLHDKCIPDGKVNLTESSLFLSGESTKYLGIKCSVKHFPKLISDAVKNIIHITGAASHTNVEENKNNIDLQEYRKQIKTSYLLYSIVFQLLDIIIWFDEYLKVNSNYDYNKSLWIEEESSEICSGIVTRIAVNGYGTFLPNKSTKTLSIIPKMVEENSLFEGQQIKVKTKTDGDKTKIIHIEI